MAPYIWGNPWPFQTRNEAPPRSPRSPPRQVSESTTEGALCILGFSNENGAAQVSVAQLVERGYYPLYPYKSL